MPYRGQRRRPSAEAPATGLVADMVRQFADPYAFLRELVQNGIDAGASALEARIEAGDGEVRFSVSDNGAGMTRAIIEGPLLTLFSTSKEGDAGSIGKYGVGFVSVFALEPEEVLVETWREGESWLVRLAPAHRYELEVAAPRPKSGTVVTLRRRLEGDELDARVASARAALRRWCRHAAVPIHLTAPGGAGTLARERIDEPLGVPAVVSIEETVDGERYVLGPSAGFAREAPPGGAPELEASPSFAGFYNRGLTLHETTEPPAPELRGLRVKIASPALGHTLSRDDVRRDRAYARVVARARALVPKLEGALAEALERAAREAAAGRDPRAYAGLLDAALAPPLRLDAARLALPLTDEVHGATTLPRCELAGRVLVAAGPSALTAALARAGRPVVRDVHPAIRAGLHGVAAADAASRFVLLHERPVPTDADRALCDAVLRGLAAAGARASRVALCRTEGASPPRAAVALAGDGEAAGRCLCSVEEAASWWRRWGAIDALLLVETSPLVERARERAAGDATQAGHLLARALLVEERGTLDATTSDRLLEAAVGDAS